MRTARRATRRRHIHVVATLLLAGAMLLTGCGEDDEPGTTPAPTDEPSATSTPSTPESPSPSTTAPAATREVGVYYMVDTRVGLRLARELKDLPADDAVAAAVEAMISGADDPDYSTPWNPATEVLGVDLAGSTIRVDLSEDARRANIGSEGAALMIQQLVYTATGAAAKPRADVVLLIEGEPAGELWGVVGWDGPVDRDPPMDVRLLVQIDTPREGAVVKDGLTVAGEANVFEATVVWEIRTEAGKYVDSSFVTTAEAFRFAPFEFQIMLDPGTYVVEIMEDDPSGGEGGVPMSDTRTVTFEK